MSGSSRPSPFPLSAARKAWHFAGLLARPRLARKLGTLVTDGYLAETGWVRGLIASEIVDMSGAAQPWATYPFVAFIGPRLRREWTVFEYGAGASTLYYANRVQRVHAVEHDPAFAAALRSRLPGNVTLTVASSDDAAYANVIRTCAPPPHIVSVDGIDRETCIAEAIARVGDSGVIILDDAERPEYVPAHDRLRNAGFRRLEFWGLASGIVTQKCTAIFYRGGNVLGI